MTICYNKLWKLLIDKNMKKKDLRLATGMSTTALAKLGKNQHVSTEILTKICEVLDCDFCDIIDWNQSEWISEIDNRLQLRPSGLCEKFSF